MARNVSFGILIAYKGFESFAAIIRPQEMAKRGAAQFKSEFDIECGLAKSEWPGHPHLWKQAVQSCKIINSGE